MPALRMHLRRHAGDRHADLRRADRRRGWSATPTMRSPSFRKPVTSQFSMMSTPSRSAACAKPQATASWRAVPPRGCSRPPTTGKRAFSLRSRPGQSLAISSASAAPRRCRSAACALPRSAYWSSCAGRVGEVQHAALREHDVVVERVAEALPELQAPLVELLVLVEAGSWSGRSWCCARHCPGRSSRARPARRCGCRAPWRDRRRWRGHGRRRPRRSRRRTRFGSALRQVGFQPLLPVSPWRSTEKTEYSAIVAPRELQVSCYSTPVGRPTASSRSSALRFHSAGPRPRARCAARIRSSHLRP